MRQILLLRVFIQHYINCKHRNCAASAHITKPEIIQAPPKSVTQRLF